MTRLMFLITTSALLFFVTGCLSTSTKNNKFRVEVQLNKRIFSPQEPIKLFFKYTNITPRPQRLSKSSLWSTNKVILTTNDGTAVSPTELGRKCLSTLNVLDETHRMNSINLKPGQKYVSYIKNLRRFYDLKKGQVYKIQLIFYDQNAPKAEREIPSNIFFFRIKPF